jgi:hypothetical protein
MGIDSVQPFTATAPSGLAVPEAAPSAAIIESETIKRAGYSLVSCSILS